MVCQGPIGCGYRFCWLCLADASKIAIRGPHRHQPTCLYYISALGVDSDSDTFSHSGVSSRCLTSCENLSVTLEKDSNSHTTKEESCDDDDEYTTDEITDDEYIYYLSGVDSEAFLQSETEDDSE